VTIEPDAAISRRPCARHAAGRQPAAAAVRDFALIKVDGVVTRTSPASARLLGGRAGPDEMDAGCWMRSSPHQGGPVGLNTLAVVVGERRGRSRTLTSRF
jgi:Holliday junction resolvasome RuvABC ATP-dependent DNA helicase subunit